MYPFNVAADCLVCECAIENGTDDALTVFSLVLFSKRGAPGSGKSTLLKMIADTLYKSKDHVVGGEVTVAGVSPAKGVYWSNVVTYVDQIDRIHPFMTVQEVCEFAFNCGSGGTHRQKFYKEGPEVDEMILDMDKNMVVVNRVLKVLGLTRVKDTFVGDQTTVRGVSGGEKKRVTVAEMVVVSLFLIDSIRYSTV